MRKLIWGILILVVGVAVMKLMQQTPWAQDPNALSDCTIISSQTLWCDNIYFSEWFEFHTCLLIKGQCNLMDIERGHAIFDAFIIMMLLGIKPAINRYKAWKRWMQANNRPITWKSWFGF